MSDKSRSRSRSPLKRSHTVSQRDRSYSSDSSSSRSRSHHKDRKRSLSRSHRNRRSSDSISRSRSRHSSHHKDRKRSRSSHKKDHKKDRSFSPSRSRSHHKDRKKSRHSKSEIDRKHKKKKEKHDKHKHKHKKSKKHEPQQLSLTNHYFRYGKYGIIRDTDFYSKIEEFNTWLVDIKHVMRDQLSKREESEFWKIFVEDYNTATFPTMKYYNLHSWDYQQSLLKKSEDFDIPSGVSDEEALRLRNIAIKEREVRGREAMRMQAFKSEIRTKRDREFEETRIMQSF